MGENELMDRYKDAIVKIRCVFSTWPMDPEGTVRLVEDEARKLRSLRDEYKARLQSAKSLATANEGKASRLERENDGLLEALRQADFALYRATFGDAKDEDYGQCCEAAPIVRAALEKAQGMQPCSGRLATGRQEEE